MVRIQTEQHWGTAASARASRPGFSIIELLVVLAIIALLAALLMPALRRASATAARTACAHNLAQVHAAIAAYTEEHRRLPEASRRPSLGPAPLLQTRYFADVIGPYIDFESRILRCPRDRGEPPYFVRERSSYEYAFRLSGGTEGYTLTEYEDFHSDQR